METNLPKIKKYFVSQEELSEFCGYHRRGDIQRWLEQNNIEFFFGKKRKICTTTEAIERALRKEEPIQELEFCGNG